MRLNEDALVKSCILRACNTNGTPELTRKIKCKLVNDLTSEYFAMCYPMALKIEFNPLLWINASKEEKENAVVHEVCHVIVYHLYEIMDHGLEWQGCMKNAGEVPYTVYKKGGCYIE